MGRVRASSGEIVSAAVAVDAKDELAREFYVRYGFIPLPSQPNRLFYLVKSVAKLLARDPGYMDVGYGTSLPVLNLRAPLALVSQPKMALTSRAKSARL